MRKEISLVTAIIVSGFLGLALPGCSEDRNNSTRIPQLDDKS